MLEGVYLQQNEPLYARHAAGLHFFMCLISFLNKNKTQMHTKIKHMFFRPRFPGNKSILVRPSRYFSFHVRGYHIARTTNMGSKSKQTVQEGAITTKRLIWPPITLLSVFKDFMQNLTRPLDGIVGDAVQGC